MQVYFDHLKGPVEVKDSSNPRKLPIETYDADEEFSGVWGPWVKGGAVYIICRGAGAYVEIDKYRWGNVSDEQIDELPAGDSKRVEIPWGYEYPRMINMTVDPDNNITEINEDNNEESVLMYADLRAERIEFVSPQDTMLSLDAEKFEIDGTIANCGDEDGVIFPVSDFNVTLEFRNRYPNGTIGDAVFNITEHVEGPLSADEELTIPFEFDPGEKFEADGGGNYTVFLTADSSNNICESSELYCPWGEYNNFTLEDVYIHNTSGYTGGGDLVNVAKGEVCGRVVYTIGDYEYDAPTPSGGVVTTTYRDTIPDESSVGEIEFARLFVYWYTLHYDLYNDRYIPDLAEVGVTFDGHSLNKVGNYSDDPGGATGKWDLGYGLYCYDVTDYVTKGDNKATVQNNAEWPTGIHAIGLLVVYEDEDEPLTKYWINEGADVMMPDNRDFKTGLPPCSMTACFDGVKEEDTENVNATLLTVLGFFKSHNPREGHKGGDALMFNKDSIGDIVRTEDGTSHWTYVGKVAFSKCFAETGKWDDVTDHVKSEENDEGNKAMIESYSNYMMPNKQAQS
jgi:hypothetical protein